MANNREDLRKVKISKYDDGSGDHITNGYFHEWQVQDEYSESGIKRNSYAIVEHEDGKVKTYPPYRVKFVDSF